ncbi:MAG: ABC transporter permease [Gammaproteobacteria bacterium]|nr:ABC transporter permease [Gammaproteobacteria bacterium]
MTGSLESVPGSSRSTSSRAERWLAGVARAGRTTLTHAGELAFLLRDIAVALVSLRVAPRAIVRQMYVMGVESLPIVILTAVLAGIVTSQQGGYQFTGAIPLYVLGSVVAESVVLEMGPVLTAIVLVGRVGARITAELGTMKVSEQIDAFYSVGRDPIPILAAPRVVAGIVVVPVLVGIANLVGILAGMISADLTVGLGPASFLYGARLYWNSWDLFYSLTKALVFGFTIPVIAIHMGLRTEGGAEGVGKTTTQAVMFMTLAVLVMDALFPPLLLD